MKQVSLKLFTFGAAIVWGLMTPDLIAQRAEEVITSAFGGGSPFLIVYDDPQGSSRRESSGLYVRADGKWKKVFDGNFFPTPRVGGVQLQLEITKFTDRYEILSVVDGRLGIFSIESAQDSVGSFAEIGSDLIKIKDPVSKARFKLPKIENLDDIRAIQRLVDGPDGPLQLIIVSTKFQSVHGEGISFVLALDPRNQIGTQINLLQDPILLDWNFHPKSDLESMIVTKAPRPSAISLNLLRSFEEPQVFDNPSLKQWRGMLRDSPTVETVRLRTPISWLPVLDIISGTPEIGELPFKMVRIAGQEFKLCFDPRNGEGAYFLAETVVSTYNWTSLKPAFRGRPLLDSKNEPKVENSRDSRHAMVYLESGEIYFISNANGFQSLRLRPSFGFQGEIKDIKWRYLSDSKLLLVSWKTDADQKTSAYRIEEGPLRLVSQQEIAGRFFNAKELQRRVGVYGGKLAFDAVTPDSTDNDQYTQLHRLTAPHIDIVQSLTDSETRIFFPSPKSTRSLGYRFKYLEYESAEGKDLRTGIYPYSFDGKDNQEALLMRGRLVDHPNVRKDISWGLDSVRLQDGLEINLFLLAPTKEDGEKYSQLYIAVSKSSTDNARKEDIAILKKDNLSFDPDQLLDFGLIATPASSDIGSEKSKRDSRPVYAFASFRDQGTFVFQINLRRTQDSWEVAGRDGRQVSTSDLNREDVLSRVLFDDKGFIYWTKRGDQGEYDEKLVLMRVQDGKDLEVLGSERDGFRNYYELGRRAEKEEAASSDSWRIVNRDSRSKDKSEQEKLRFATIYQSNVFPKYRNLLEQLANPAVSARHIVLLVSPELAEYAYHYPQALRLQSELGAEFWTTKEAAHSLSIVGDKADQATVMKNLEAVREEVRRNKRPVLMANLRNLMALDRPKAGGERDFYIEALKPRERGISLGSVGESAEKVAIEPHILYLLSTEGRRIPLNAYKSQEVQASVPMILVGTKAEWEELVASAGIEGELAVSDSFEVVELGEPNAEFRKNILKSLFRRPDIASLGYEPSLDGVKTSAEGVSNEQAFDLLFGFMVNRAERLALDEKRSVFESFLWLLEDFEQELFYNSEFRNRREFGRAMIERVLAANFSTPLNVRYLPPNDPLQIISQENASFLWKRAGCPAPLELRERLLDVLKGQLSSHQVRNMPSSAIILGNSGTGKTRTAMSLINFLGLKLYDFLVKPQENREANGFYISMNEVNDAQAFMQHLLVFLSLPNGPRGYIILDDFHTASENVRNEVLRLVREFQDNPVFKRRVGEKYFERPVRNISLLLFINPTVSSEKIAKFSKDKGHPTDVEITLATLADSRGEIEPSTLTRFGAIINFGSFGVGSKTSALLDTLSGASDSSFMNQQRLILVGADSVEKISSQFPNADARDYLTEASNAFLGLPSGDGNLFMIVPRRLISRGEPSRSHFEASGGGNASQIRESVRRQFEAIPIVGDHRGQVSFMKFLIENFRRRAFEFVLRSISEDERFASRPEVRQLTVLPLAQSILRHLEEHPKANLEELTIDSKYFGILDVMTREAFMETLRAEIAQARIQGDNSRKLPVGIVSSVRAAQEFGSFSSMPEEKTRQHVLAETIRGLQTGFEQLLAKMIRVQDVDRLPEVETWLKQGSEVPRASSEVVADFGKILATYVDEIFSVAASGVDSISPEEITDEQREIAKEGLRMSQYEAIRFFVMAIDRAIYQMPWDAISGFLSESLRLASEDLSIGESSFVHDLLFSKNSSSPLKPFDQSWISGLASSIRLVNETAERESKWAERFSGRCDYLLRGLLP
ncbi:MAG: hypothetical protein COV44_00375 [Deltaproteobacteria bacterium CG11_big_fil_rev_8_21_14_0_20_45_16]|nr:MAG: hypothetical protein COV44_00375 [Deltaproteobacteria bacterium CG11_big_fil_rev_8_21_14_0_20_45_16]